MLITMYSRLIERNEMPIFCSFQKKKNKSDLQLKFFGIKKIKEKIFPTKSIPIKHIAFESG